MRIDPNEIVKQIPGVRLRGVKSAGSVDALVADSVDFSNRAEDFKTAMEALASTPEVRENRVNELQQQIEQGKYDTSEAALAEKLFGSKNAG